MEKEKKEVYKILIALNLNNKEDGIVMDSLQLVVDLLNLNLGINGRKFVTQTMKWIKNNNTDMAIQLEKVIYDKSILCVVGTLKYLIIYLVIMKEMQLNQYQKIVINYVFQYLIQEQKQNIKILFK